MAKLNMPIAPNLPIAQDTYQKSFGDKLTNILRLYFNQIDSFNRTVRSYPLIGAYCAVTQTLAIANTATKVPFPTTEYSQDITTEATQTKFSAVIEGYYQIIVNARVTKSTSATATVSLWLRKNGANSINSNQALFLSQATTEQDCLNLTRTVYLRATEYIEVYWTATSNTVSLAASTGITNAPDAPATYMTMRYIST